jgi:hypothetical protein
MLCKKMPFNSGVPGDPTPPKQNPMRFRTSEISGSETQMAYTSGINCLEIGGAGPHGVLPLNGIFLRYIKMNSNLQLKLPVISNNKPAEIAKPPVGINLMLPVPAAVVKPPASVNLNLMLPAAETESLNNNLEFSNNGKKWMPSDLEQLNKLYNVENRDITQISNILNRTPHSICCQLIKNKYITDKKLARGYDDCIKNKSYKLEDFKSQTDEVADAAEKETVNSHWNSFEDNYLNKHYNIDNYDVEKIADLHNRSVSSIIDRLVKLKYITDKKSARGYENINELASLKNEVQILKEELNKLKSMLESST